MKKGRVTILYKLFTAKKGSSYEKIIKETYSMMSKKNKKIIIKYSTKPNDTKAYDAESGDIKFMWGDDMKPIVAYHNSIHQLIKIFDARK